MRQPGSSFEFKKHDLGPPKGRGTRHSSFAHITSLFVFGSRLRFLFFRVFCSLDFPGCVCGCWLRRRYVDEACSPIDHFLPMSRARSSAAYSHTHVPLRSLHHARSCGDVRFVPSASLLTITSGPYGVIRGWPENSNSDLSGLSLGMSVHARSGRALQPRL